ncbi:hypothetical protein cypCar_00035028, partial [Cyprinus carpio]
MSKNEVSRADSFQGINRSLAVIEACLHLSRRSSLISETTGNSCKMPLFGFN